MKIWLLFLSFFCGFSQVSASGFDAELLEVVFYGKGACDAGSPVFVRVSYAIKGKNLRGMRMQHTFSNGINSTTPVLKIDKKGNAVYEFCVGRGEALNFTTRFIADDGQKSNSVRVQSRASEDKIIDGTPPQTLSL